MHAAVYDSAAGAPPNFARFTFLELEAAQDFYPRWDVAADTCVAILRTEAGRDPHDKALHDLVGELSTRSGDFRRRWGSHDVRLHGAGSKLFHHGVVGDLDLAYESVDMISDPGPPHALTDLRRRSPARGHRRAALDDLDWRHLSPRAASRTAGTPTSPLGDESQPSAHRQHGASTSPSSL